MICPFLVVCKAKITYEYYVNTCINYQREAYKDCNEYKKMSVEQKSPLEWNKIVPFTGPVIQPSQS